MSRRFRLVLSGAFAALALVLCLAYGEQVRAEEQRARQESLERYGGEVVTLVVATRELALGEVVGTQDVEERDWVSDLVPEGAFTSRDDVVGRSVTAPAAAGAPLTETNFREERSAVEVPSGKVALSIPVTDRLGLGDAVSAGGRLVAYRVTDGSVTLLSADVSVLSVPERVSSLSSSQSMTLAVSPSDVSALLSASTEGSLRLAVPADDLSVDAVAVPSAPTNVTAETGDTDEATEQSGESSATTDETEGE